MATILGTRQYKYPTMSNRRVLDLTQHNQDVTNVSYTHHYNGIHHQRKLSFLLLPTKEIFPSCTGCFSYCARKPTIRELSRIPQAGERKKGCVSKRISISPHATGHRKSSSHAECLLIGHPSWTYVYPSSSFTETKMSVKLVDERSTISWGTFTFLAISQKKTFW